MLPSSSCKQPSLPCTTLDLRGTDSVVDVDRGMQVAAEIRRKVHEASQLTCSVGIAADPMIAKVCSDLNKPDGQYEVPFTRDAVVDFVRGLKTRKVPGVGKVLHAPVFAQLSQRRDLIRHTQQ